MAKEILLITTLKEATRLQLTSTMKISKTRSKRLNSIGMVYLGVW
jgi:hypothetical protein